MFGVKKCVIHVVKDDVIFHSTSKVNPNSTVYQLKCSIGSQVRHLRNLIAVNITQERFLSRLALYEMNLGVPGFGKTYSILNNTTKQDLIVYCTSGARNGMEKLMIKHNWIWKKKNVTIISAEKLGEDYIQ